MEVVPHLPSSAGAAASPFARHDVAEWSRMDRLTGVMETARVETDRWAQATPTANHAYGKVVDSRDRSLPDGSARQRQRQQLEVFQTHGPGGSLQVIRTQSVTSTNSSWRTSTSSAQPSRTAALPPITRDFGGDLQMTLNPLDLSREKNKGSVGRSGSIGARRPPSRPRALPPPPPAPAPAGDKAGLEPVKETEKETVKSVAALHDPPLVALHSLLSRQRSSSTEDVTACLDATEPDALRRSSRARRSLQFSARSLEARGGVARLLQDLEERGVPQGSDPGRSVNNVSLDSFSRKFANAKMRHSYSESNDDDEADAERKKVATKRHSFVTVESLKEVRGRLKPREDGVDVGRAPDDAKEVDAETAATSLVKSYVFGMEEMSRGRQAQPGTGSLESRTGGRAGRSDEWYNRRKSYGFEHVAGDTSNSSSSTLSSGAGAVESTDSGIHHSSEMFSTPTWSRRTALVPTEDTVKRGSTVVNLGGDATEPPVRGALLSALLVNGVRGDDRRMAVSIPVTLSDDSPTVESRRLFYQQLAQGTTLSVERALKKSLEQTTTKAAVGDDWWMRPRFGELASTDEWTLPSLGAKRHSFAGNGWRTDAVDVDAVEVKRHSIAVDEPRYGDEQGTAAVAGETDRKNGVSVGKKRVEFCKTEVHFAAEPGRFNIVETDEKPPSTNMFRRRRRSTNVAPAGGVVAVASNLPEVRFGDHERAGKEAATTSSSSPQRTTTRPTTLRLNLEEDVQEKEHQVYTESNATIRPAAEDQEEDEYTGQLELMDSSIDSRPRGILKPRVRPPAYLLGAHQSDGEPHRQGPESDASEERWGVRLRPVDAPARPAPSRDAVMPAEYSGQSELQKLLRSLRPAAQRPRAETDVDSKAEWCATDRLNGAQEPDWAAAEHNDVEKVPGWTPKSDRGSDWADRPTKLTDWSSKTEKSSEWLNETEKLADWSPMAEKIADWTSKTENGSSWQSKSMERQNKFTERLNAKVEKLAGTRTEKLSNWSPKSTTGSERLTKSLDRPNNLTDRQLAKSEDNRSEPRTDKLSDWSPKAEKLSDWSPKKEKLSDWSPAKTDKLSDWTAKTDKLTDYSPKTEKRTDWSAKAEKLSDWSTKTETLTDWSPKTEKLADWSVAERVRSVEQSKGFSTRVNFGPGETTVVAAAATTTATPTEARRFSSGDRPKPVWQRREEALAAADGKPAVGTTTKITIDLTSLTLALDAPRARPPTWSSPAIGDRGIADGEGSPDKVENGFLRLCVGDDRERGWDDVLVASSLPPVNGHPDPATPSWVDEETTWYDNKQYRQHATAPGRGVQKACVEQRTWMERSSATKSAWKPKTSWGGRVWDKEDGGQATLDAARAPRRGEEKRHTADSEEKGPSEELVVTERSWRKDDAGEKQELVIDESSWKKSERVDKAWGHCGGDSSKEKDAPDELLVDEPSWRARKQLKEVTAASVWRKADTHDAHRDEDCATTTPVEATPTPMAGSGLGAQLAAWRALCGESDSSESVSDQEADLEVRAFMSHEASGSWRRRRPGEGYAAVESESHHAVHTSTTMAPVPSYDAGRLRSVETLVNVRSGQPRITSISLRYQGDDAATSVRLGQDAAVQAPAVDARRHNGVLTKLNGTSEPSTKKEPGKYTSRTSISPERPTRESPVPIESAFKSSTESTPSRSLFSTDAHKPDDAVECVASRLTASFERRAGRKSPDATPTATLFGKRPDAAAETGVDGARFQRSSPGRARLRTAETHVKVSRERVDTEIGTVKQAVSASPLAARRVSAASSVGSSSREPIGRKQAAEAPTTREPNGRKQGVETQSNKETNPRKQSVEPSTPPRRPASLKDITEASPVTNGIASESARHTFASSSYQRHAESCRLRVRSGSQSPDADGGSPSGELFGARSPLGAATPRSASLSPVYQNRAFYRENSGLEAESDSVILAELTRAAEEILRAVHGYTDDETQQSVSEQHDTRHTNQRRQLGTIAETQVLRKTAAKEVRSQRETTRLASKVKTKLGPTSSNSSVESVEPRRPIRADPATKRPIRGEVTSKRPISGETTEKRPTRTERVSRTARMVQRASSRELLLQTHASSSEDVASGSEGQKQRAPPRRRSTAAKGTASAVKTPSGRTEKPVAEPVAGRVSRDRTSSSRTKSRDSTTATTVTDVARKTPETKQYPLKEKTIPGIVSQRDRSSRAGVGAAAAVRAKKTPSSRTAPLTAKSGK